MYKPRLKLRDLFLSVAFVGVAAASCTHEKNAPQAASAAADSVVAEDANKVEMLPPFRERTAWIGRQDSILAHDTAAASLFKGWLSQFDKYKHASLYAKAIAVDNAVDRAVTWMSDSANYNGAFEYFAPPVETLKRHAGDCDDFATLKYEAMRYLGVRDDRIYIMGVSSKPGGDMDHAILALDTSRNKDKSGVVILDNIGKDQDMCGKAPSLWEKGYKPFYIANRKYGMKTAGIAP